MSKKLINCLYCNKEHSCDRYRNTKFCSKSCGSKYNIKFGNGLKGLEYGRKLAQENLKLDVYINKICVICGSSYKTKNTARERNLNRSKTCSKLCKYEYMKSLFSGSGNPSYGKKETLTSKEKKKKTLQEKYGVVNAYELAKHTFHSRPEMELKQLIEEQLKIKCVNERIRTKDKTYIPDISFTYKEQKFIVEYFGDYWHCNPNIYKKDYFHKKKAKNAVDIWGEDKRRINKLKKLNYNVYIVWETDWNHNKEKSVQDIINFTEGKMKNGRTINYK